MKTGRSANKSTRVITSRVDHETVDLWEAMVAAAAESGQEQPARWLMVTAVKELFDILGRDYGPDFEAAVRHHIELIKQRRQGEDRCQF